MRKTLLALGTALVMVPGIASAQNVAETYSYSAPSGSFSEGTAKWQMFRYLAEDAEQRARLRAGEDFATGSIQGSAVTGEQVRRPGERGERLRAVR